MHERRIKPTLGEKYQEYPTHLIPGTEREELWEFPLFENKNNSVSPPKASTDVLRVLSGRSWGSTTAQEVTQVIPSYFFNITKVVENQVTLKKTGQAA